jgi:F0F1-type ATP synthase assembly protein I
VDLRDRQQLNKGFGDGLSRAFELSATPAIFAGLGWLIDRWVGTQPLFLLVFFFFAIAGVGYMTWHRYDEEMREHETEAVWNRDRRRVHQ